MSILARPLTYDDLLELRPLGDVRRYEILDGELIVIASPLPNHQRLLQRVYRTLYAAGEETGLGEVFVAPLDVRLSPHDIVQPDVLFIRRERLAIVATGPVEGPPDIVVEIASPNSRYYDQVRKAAVYAASGVPEYWFADLERRRFDLLVPSAGGAYEPVQPQDGRLRSTVLPDLALDVAALFAGIT